MPPVLASGGAPCPAGAAVSLTLRGQDASTARDTQLVANVNAMLQDPNYAPVWADAPAPAPPQAPAATYVTPLPPRTSDVTSPAPRSGGPVPAPTEQQLSELRSILSQISRAPGAHAHAPGTSRPAPAAPPPRRSRPPELALADVLTPANLAPLFASAALVRTLFPHLPPDLPVPPSAEALQRIVESPQFHAAVRALDQALATGLLGGLVRGLGLPEDAGTGVGAFLRAIAQQAQADPSGGGGGGDDAMETD